MNRCCLRRLKRELGLFLTTLRMDVAVIFTFIYGGLIFVPPDCFGANSTNYPGVDLEEGCRQCVPPQFFIALGHLTLYGPLKQKGCTKSCKLNLKLHFFSPLLRGQIPLRPIPIVRNLGASSFTNPGSSLVTFAMLFAM